MPKIDLMTCIYQGWKSTGLRAHEDPANEGKDEFAPKRFSSMVLTNGL